MQTVYVNVYDCLSHCIAGTNKCLATINSDTADGAQVKVGKVGYSVGCSYGPYAYHGALLKCNWQCNTQWQC
jgi:hypothetical protein